MLRGCLPLSRAGGVSCSLTTVFAVVPNAVGYEFNFVHRKTRLLINAC